MAATADPEVGAGRGNAIGRGDEGVDDPAAHETIFVFGDLDFHLFAGDAEGHKRRATIAEARDALPAINLLLQCDHLIFHGLILLPIQLSFAFSG